MQSWLDEGEGWTLYQTGTFAAIGGVRKTPKFRMSLFDPVLDRTIEAQYNTVELPAVK